MTKPTTEEIIAKAEELLDTIDQQFIGVRTQEQPFELGPIDHVSQVWVDGDETDEELDGICVTAIGDGPWAESDVRQHASDHDPVGPYYPFDHVALIAYDRCSYGEDEGEVIANDAEVVYVFC